MNKKHRRSASKKSSSNRSNEAKRGRGPKPDAAKRPQHKLGASNAKSIPDQFLEGLLKLHRDGYGFVISETPGVPDVFVPARRMKGAMNGDRVIVTVRQGSGDGRLEGSVSEILKRGSAWLLGLLQKRGENYVAVIQDKSGVTEFVIPPKKLNGAEAGQSVGLKITKYPEEHAPGMAEVVQVFERRGDPGTELQIIILKHQLPHKFPDEVVSEALAWQKDRDFEPEGDRRDLRELPFVTIDGETAKDFDDAICVKPEGKGWRLWVSIADVSHYVTPDSALDREAFRRGTSVYFPDYVIPMLPEELSNDLCSLRPKEDRLTFTCEILFDERGVPKATDIYKSVIHSKARLTYKQVAAALVEQMPEVRMTMAPVLPMLEEAFKLYKQIRARRTERGSIDFDLPEAEVQLSFEDGTVEGIVRAQRNEAHLLIEDFMIAANEAVARFITQKRTPGIYRVHGEPDPDKVKRFQELLHNLNFNIAFPEKPRPGFFNKVLKQVKGHAEERLIQHILLRSMRQAVYSEKNLGHFGLASICYTHFTSPIRRYPDLMVHRVLQSILANAAPRTEKAKEIRETELSQAASHCSRRERTAMEAEWEAIDLQKALFMQKYVGETFAGAISRIAKFGFFVELQEYFVEGLVSLNDIEDDYYIYDERKHRLRGRKSGRVFKIGTELSITVAKVDIEAREIYFAVSS